MRIELPHTVGERVWYARKEPTLGLPKCEACSSTGQVVLNDAHYTCPGCGGELKQVTFTFTPAHGEILQIWTETTRYYTRAWYILAGSGEKIASGHVAQTEEDCARLCTRAAERPEVEEHRLLRKK